MCIELFVIFSDDDLNFREICGDCPLIFFIASIWLFSLFYFISLASGLSSFFIFSKKQLLDLLIFWRVFRASISFSSALILVISCLLLGFEFFWSCSRGARYIFSSRDCFKCVPKILVCSVFVLVGFEELLYFCLHFIVYLVNILELVVQFPWRCAVLS